jgi:sulfopyruvate decarboxylase subunit beta
LALSLPKQKVVVLDGDGSVLMNLGGLSTMARYKPKNLVHVIFDNESLLSVGGFPTATATGTDLEKVARASGVQSTSTAVTCEEFTKQFRNAVEGDQLACIVAKVYATGPSKFVTDLPLLENRFQFRRYIQSLGSK